MTGVDTTNLKLCNLYRPTWLKIVVVFDQIMDNINYQLQEKLYLCLLFLSDMKSWVCLIWCDLNISANSNNGLRWLNRDGYY